MEAKDKVKLYNRPLRLEQNRISYLIKGGELIDNFLGKEHVDTSLSQMWIASTVSSVLGDGTEGFSRLIQEDGGHLLKDLLEKNPPSYLGGPHTEKWGHSLGILVKLLNSEDRLLVQTHPNKEKAMKYFNSRFGKTEAWYVVDTKPGEPAFVYAGFKPDINKEIFRQYIQAQDTEKILASLHQFEIHAGDVIFIPAGLPHALGNHSLVVEIQEPTDITLRAERIRPDGSVLPEESLHSGIGMDGLLDCFDFSSSDKEETRRKIFIEPRIIVRGEGLTEFELIGREVTDCFSMKKILIEGGSQHVKTNPSFLAVLVLEGQGTIRSGETIIPINRGSELFLPAGVTEYEYRADKTLEILEFYPPH